MSRDPRHPTTFDVPAVQQQDKIAYAELEARLAQAEADRDRLTVELQQTRKDRDRLADALAGEQQ